MILYMLLYSSIFCPITHRHNTADVFEDCICPIGTQLLARAGWFLQVRGRYIDVLTSELLFCLSWSTYWLTQWLNLTWTTINWVAKPLPCSFQFIIFLLYVRLVTSYWITDVLWLSVCRKNELDELLNSLLDSNEINDEVTIDYINRFLSLQLD